MESAGIYWRSHYTALEVAGIRTKVVNARHVKYVSGRKTDIHDAQWLATLSRAGLLRASYIPPAYYARTTPDRPVTAKTCRTTCLWKESSAQNIHDDGIRLGAVVSDVHGQSARAVIKGAHRGQDASRSI